MTHRSPKLWLCLVATAVAGGVSPAMADAPGDPIEHQFVLKLGPGEDIDDIAASYGAVVIARYEPARLYLLESAPDMDDNDQEAEFDLDDRIEESEQNALNAVFGGNTQSFFVRVIHSPYPTQPAAAVLELPRAHERSTGESIVVAVLDTGVAPHPILAPQRRGDGFDFMTNTPDAPDAGVGLMRGHGTFIAGCIHLVAPSAAILPVAVLDGTGYGTSFTVAEGIYYAVEHGAHVINLSLSTPTASGAISSAIAFARSRGVLVVAAVGNHGADDASFPAGDVGVLAVTALGLDDVKPAFADYGKTVDLCAPGVQVVSTLPDGSYGMASGTSFAAAYVTGSAALLRAVVPQATPAQLERRLMNSAISVDVRNPDMEGDLGSGRVRPWDALVNRKPPPTPATRR